jgi:hypothetical protein
MFFAVRIGAPRSVTSVGSAFSSIGLMAEGRLADRPPELPGLRGTPVAEEPDLDATTAGLGPLPEWGAAGAGCAGALAGFGGGVVAGRGAGASAGGGVVAAGAGGVVGLAKATLAGTGAEGSATATGGLFAGGAASSAARAAKNARHAGSTELGSDE